MAGCVWAPLLADVARLIPARTRDKASPGSDRHLGTFTDGTTPNAGQAQQAIDDAVTAVAAAVGDLPSAHPRLAELHQAARIAAAWRAAADIELAYPERASSERQAQNLTARADAALAALRSALEGTVEAEPGLVPVWFTPGTPGWADSLLT